MLVKISKQFTKHTVHNLSFSARERMQPTAVLHTPAWARGPGANQQAAEPACAPLPPEPKPGPRATGR
jgi:hypothetical protein